MFYSQFLGRASVRIPVDDRYQIFDILRHLAGDRIILQPTERPAQCWNCPILGGGLGFWILWSTCRRTKFANHNPARAQPRFKSWGVWIGRSPNRGREAPEIWGWSLNRGRSPRKSGGRGLGRGLGEPLPRKFLEFRTSNRSIWCTVEKGIRK